MHNADYADYKLGDKPSGKDYTYILRWIAYAEKLESLLGTWLSYADQGGDVPKLLDMGNPVHKLIHDTKSTIGDAHD